MSIFLSIDKWVEKHWPSKMTVEDVHKEFARFDAHVVGLTKEFAQVTNEIKSLLERVHLLEKMFEDFKKLKEEVTMLKAQSNVKTRLAGSIPDTMTPFAQRLPPVVPAGGNQSPR